MEEGRGDKGQQHGDIERPDGEGGDEREARRT